MTRAVLVIAILCAGCGASAANAPVAPAQALHAPDLTIVSHAGEDVPSLAAHVAPGKVTVVDFYADWCGPCRDVGTYVQGLLAERPDVALRKINIGDWDTPVAKRYLAKVPTLPYVIIFGRDGKVVRDISGLDLDAIHDAVDEGSRR